jgi:hypothetical protein
MHPENLFSRPCFPSHKSGPVSVGSCRQALGKGKGHLATMERPHLDGEPGRISRKVSWPAQYCEVLSLTSAFGFLDTR